MKRVAGSGLAALCLAVYCVCEAGAAGGLQIANKQSRLTRPQMERLAGVSFAGQAQSVVDHSWLIPSPREEDDDDECVAYAAAYYMSFLQALQYGDAWSTDSLADVRRLGDDGARYFFHFAGEVLLQRGARINSRSFYILGYAPLFTNAMRFDNDGRVRQPFRNNIALLQEWISPADSDPGPLAEGGYAGNCVLLGIPVGADWDEHVSDGPGQPYTFDPSREDFHQFRAVCVVGYDKSRKVFKFINSQGDGWGDHGYGYLTFDFVEQYALEAWVLVDQKGFLAGESETPAKKSGNKQIWENDDFMVTYMGPSNATLSVTSQGIVVINAGDNDLLQIRRKRGGRTFLEPIPKVIGDYFRRFFTELQVWDLATTSGAQSVTARNACVNQIRTAVAKGAGDASAAASQTPRGQDMNVNVLTGVNDTFRLIYPFTSPYEAGIGEAAAPLPGDVRPFPNSIYVSTTTDTARRISARFVGARVNVSSRKSRVSLNGAWRKLVSRGAPDAASECGVGNIDCQALDRCSLRGGQLFGGIATNSEGDVGPIIATGQVFSSTVQFPESTRRRETFFLDSEIDASLFCDGSVRSIVTRGGSIYVSGHCRNTFGPVRALELLYRRGDNVLRAGGDAYCSLAAGIENMFSNQPNDPRAAAPKTAKPDFNIWGDKTVEGRLIAGCEAADNRYFINPTHDGAVTIGTKAPYENWPPAFGYDADPAIEGESWADEDRSNIRWWQADWMFHPPASGDVAIDSYDIYDSPIPLVTPPDNFADAAIIAGDEGTSWTHNIEATREAGEPQHNGAAQGNSVWFRWTALSNQFTYFNLYSSGFSAIVAIYTGTELSNLTLVDSGFGSAFVNPTAGATYYIAVEGYFDPQIGQPEAGVVSLDWY